MKKDSQKSLFEFLEKHNSKNTNINKNNNKHTHQLIPGLVNINNIYTFYIPPEKYEQFTRLYIDYISNPSNKLSLTEVIGDVSRLMIDIDMKYDNDDHSIIDKQYTPKTIELIAKHAWTVINKFVILNNDSGKNYNRVIVMEKDKIIYKDDKKNNVSIAKDGIHIIFPHVVISRDIQKKIVEEMINSKYSVIGENVINTMKSKPLNEVNSIPDNKLKLMLDTSIYKNGKMIMLGSQKPDNIPYSVSKVYTINKDENDNLSIKYEDKDAIYDKESLYYLNSLYNNPSQECEYIVKDEETNSSKKDKKKSKKNKNNDEDNTIDINEMKRIKNENPIIEDNIDRCRKLVGFLSDLRCSEYSSWINVGFCLKNISCADKYIENESEYLELWKDFSRRSTKYKEGECEKRWYNDFKNNIEEHNKITIKSLYYWAKSDNKEAYDKYYNTTIQSDIEKIIKYKSHTDIAKLIYKSAPGDYACISLKNSDWFYFNNTNGTWKPSDNAIHLRKYITRRIRDIFTYYLKYFNEEAKKTPEEDNDDKDENIWSKRANACAKIFTQLGDSGFKSSIVKECAEFYYDEKFLDNLDSEKNIFALENCVCDLDKGIFRLGEPSDCVSLSTDIPITLYDDQLFPITINHYIQQMNTIKSNYKMLRTGLMDFLNKVLPIEEVRDYTLKKLASCLTGEIREEKFNIWTGSGGNGKSKLIDLIDIVFGQYSCKLPVSLLTQKRGLSSSANPELERTKGARFVSLQEPDANENINIGLMKELTGGDTITARKLYGNPVDFKPQFSMVLMCNQLPDVPGNDDGTWRRMEVVKFPSKFRDIKDEEEDHENYIYKMDTQLSSKLKEWALPLLIELLDIYNNQYNKPEDEGGGIHAPPEVVKHTKNYRAKNDKLSKFMDECYEVSEEVTTLTSIVKCFKAWFSDNKMTNNEKMPSRDDLQEQVIKMQKDTEYGYVSGQKKFNFIEKEADSDEE